MNSNNPLLCDPQTGVCELPGTASETDSVNVTPVKKPIKIIYFTDPICSSCWGIEPQLRKLKLEYGNSYEIEYKMGGLLPDWSYNSGGISKPSDVAHHWDEVSAYYDMPIDGDVWLEDPLNSSYPPSIAFKAAELQSKEKALLFMREMREMVFLEKKNIAKWEVISVAAKQTGLDVAKLKADFDGPAQDLFKADLELARKMGVRGFPTMFFVDSNEQRQVVYGFKPYQEFENTMIKTFPEATKNNYDKNWQSIFNKYPTLTTREFAELSNINKKEAEGVLTGLVKEGKLQKQISKNGPLWLLPKLIK